MFGRFVKGVVLVLLIAGAAIGGYVYNSLSTLEHETLTEDVHVIFGFGGNVGVLRTDAGTVIVDTMAFPMQGERIRELARELTGQPVRVVINTHYHLDHTHGNPAFDSDVRIVSSEATRQHMLELDGAFWDGAHTRALPNETFGPSAGGFGVRDPEAPPEADEAAESGTHEHTIAIGGKTVRLRHLGAGHTDGDVVVSFEEDRVLHTGDLVFNRAYPNIDLEGGGSIPAWIATLDRVVDLDFDRVIPGHGPPTDVAGIRTYQEFLKELWQIALDANERKLSLEQMRAENRLRGDADYAVFHVPFIITLDRDFVLGRAFEEACPGKVENGTCLRDTAEP
jgi:glyoxylase-like metal-dependent hydrolase (beta-lactamase superfamily II)